ncbi:iron complex outermembrane recepter protein [Spirosomataceae bacterium TFI 002]|nr:iron complex outermembrane recepter protein [Spirosomataceae bacterium TFI 002]
MNNLTQLGRLRLSNGLQCISLKSTFALVFAALISFSSLAQSVSVKGKVTDGDAFGLPGVTIQVKGSSNGVATDVEGNYVINDVPSKATLVFSFVGMNTQEIAVDGKTTINVTLSDDAQTLEEIVVVGYGTQKRKEISGTVTSLGSKDFNAGLVTDPLQAAAGKVAGLVITQSSGDPNAAPTVRLRGTGSLTAGSEPLYVIDGVVGAPIQNVNPNDILTMDILRDASSAAIYGARGANGVIILTTKRGKSGVPSVDVNISMSTENISQRPDMMNGAQFREAATKYNQPFNDNGANTNWLDAITRTATTQNYNVGVSGGNDKSSYRASLGYLDQVGTLIGSGRDRLNARLNLDTKALNDKLLFAFNFSASQTNADIAQLMALGLAVNSRPTDPLYNSDGSYYQEPGTFSNFNPLAVVENRSQKERISDILSNVQASYLITDELTFKVSGTLRTQDKNNTGFQNAITNVPLNGYSGNVGYRSLNAEQDKQIETTLNYNKDLGGSRLGLLAGYQYQDVISDGFGVQNQNFLTDILGADNIGTGLGIRSNPGFIGSYKNEYKLVSFFGRAQYTLADKYFATVNLRRDGSTKFGENNKWGFFPSASVGWAISEEAFLKGSDVVTNLKLRANWGRVGNSNGINPLQAQSVYGPAGSYYDGVSGSFLPAYAIQSNPNPDLKWEVNQSYGVGLDYTLWKGKLQGSIDWYTRDTQDLLYTVNAPQEKGYVFPTILANIGSMKNKGFEITASYQWIDTQKFGFSSTFAGSFNENEVVSLQNSEFAAPDQVFLQSSLGDFIRGTSAVNFSVLQAGYPVGVFYGYQVSDINESGKYVFKDLDGNGSIDDNDRTYIGNPTPTFVGSLTNNFNFGNFALTFMLQSNLGGKVMNTNALLLGKQNGRIPESNGLVSTLTSPVNDDQTVSMDYYVENANFLRLNNARLGYNLPKTGNVLNRANIFISGNNLFLLTKYSGVDPEVSQGLSIGNSAPGIDIRNTYYKTRVFTAGVNLTF